MFFQAQIERQRLAEAMKRQKEQQRKDEARRRRLEEDAQALARKQTEINRRLEEAKRVQELADQERAAAQARRQQEMVRMCTARVGYERASMLLDCVCTRWFDHLLFSDTQVTSATTHSAHSGTAQATAATRGSTAQARGSHREGSSQAASATGAFAKS